MKWVSFLLAWSALQGANIAAEIKINQVGYLPEGTKFAMIVSAKTDEKGHPSGFFLVRRVGNDSVAFRSSLGASAFDADTGDQVQPADFSKLKENGTFYLDVPGVGKSWNFRIAPDVFLRTYYLAARSYYGQRCGTAVDLGPEFAGYRHGVCHTEGAYDPSSEKQGQHASAQGWHDAGDYGRYVVNSGISTATLLWAWELFGKPVQAVSLQLPESGNGVPDLLNEARWNIDWMLSMQDADGGVWHKQTSSHFCGFIMPEADKLTSLVIGAGQSPFKTSCATADFAAVTAIAARAFLPFDPDYARRCLAASRKAWIWLQGNPNVVFRNPPGISTGDYGDAHCDDEQLWAAAELLRTTGEAEYDSYFTRHYRQYLPTVRANNPPSWAMMAPFALWSYVLGNGKDSEARQDIRRAIVGCRRRDGGPYTHAAVSHHHDGQGLYLGIERRCRQLLHAVADCKQISGGRALCERGCRKSALSIGSEHLRFILGDAGRFPFRATHSSSPKFGGRPRRALARPAGGRTQSRAAGSRDEKAAASGHTARQGLCGFGRRVCLQ